MWDFYKGRMGVYHGVDIDPSKTGYVFVRYVKASKSLGHVIKHMLTLKPKIERFPYSLLEESIIRVHTEDLDNDGVPLDIIVLLPPNDDANSVLKQIKVLGLGSLTALTEQLGKAKYDSSIAKTNVLNKTKEQAELNKEEPKPYDPYNDTNNNFRNRNIDGIKGVDK